MNPFEMVVCIVFITAIASVLRAKYGVTRDFKGNELFHRPDPDAARAQEEIKQLKERIAVLERLATDSNNSAASLEREIEQLRGK